MMTRVEHRTKITLVYMNDFILLFQILFMFSIVSYILVHG